MKILISTGLKKSAQMLLNTFIGTSALLLTVEANAFSNFPGAVDAAAKSLYGATASYNFSCMGCHGSSGFGLATGFGVDFKATSQSLYAGVSIGALSNTQVTEIIKNYGTKDSDSDTASNQAEFLAATNPGDPASKPAPVCVRANPSLKFTTVSQSTVAGTSASYQLTLTNNDSAACTSSTFSLAQTVPSGITGALSMQSLVLAPGANQNFSISITPLATMAAGSYNFSVSATNSAATTFTVSANGTVVVTLPPPPPSPTPTATPTATPTPTCTPKAPDVILNPSSQNAEPGDNKKFQ
jgi:hypothetical protein